MYVYLSSSISQLKLLWGFCDDSNIKCQQIFKYLRGELSWLFCQTFLFLVFFKLSIKKKMSQNDVRINVVK